MQRLTSLDIASVGAAGLIALFCLITGCSGGGSEPLPELIPVTGTVLLDGQPLAGAVVSFTPSQRSADGFGRTSRGSTGPDGGFSLQYTSHAAGAIPGDHVVQISKTNGTADEGGGDEVLPARYNATTQLKATVSPSEPQHFEFELHSRAR